MPPEEAAEAPEEPPEEPPRRAPRRASPDESWTSGAVGCGGMVGETPAGPATPGSTVAPRAALPFLPAAGGAPDSPSAARAWDIRIASIVMSWRISERLQARSASSHMVVR
nr:hypothetical protein [Streptomyces avermitilis]